MKKQTLKVVGAAAVVVAALWLSASYPQKYQQKHQQDYPQAPKKASSEAVVMTQAQAPRSEFAQKVQGGAKVAESPLMTVYRKYKTLKQKSLRSADEEREWLALLLNQALLEGARDVLRSEEFADAAYERNRLDAIAYLGDAMRVNDRQARARVSKMIVGLLKKDRLEPGMPEAQQKSLLGDTVELYRILATYQPKQALKLMEGAKGTHLFKVYQFASAVQDEVMMKRSN